MHFGRHDLQKKRQKNRLFRGKWTKMDNQLGQIFTNELGKDLPLDSNDGLEGDSCHQLEYL
jgi:hypothetical protein